MASYNDLVTIANNNAFQNRVKYALESAAISIYNEASSSTGHTARVAYASGVIGGNYSLFPTALAVLTNSTLGSEANLAHPPDFGIPDSDLQFAVNSMWDALANA